MPIITLALLYMHMHLSLSRVCTLVKYLNKSRHATHLKAPRHPSQLVITYDRKHVSLLRKVRSRHSAGMALFCVGCARTKVYKQTLRGSVSAQKL